MPLRAWLLLIAASALADKGGASTLEVIGVWAIALAAYVPIRIARLIIRKASS